jgi:hypothetical protein
MAIPVYQARTFEKVVTGGRNKPWLLTVETDIGPALYVTKFFARQDIEQQNALGREVYAGGLAREFGLNIPDFALITIDEAFRETLPKKLRDQLNRKHTQFGFGSEFIPGEHTYTPALLAKELAAYDIASIFAFDVLILNTDRRNKKPNILLDNDRYYLIDHEHTFALPQDVEPRQRVSNYYFKNHIFYDVLHRKVRYGRNPEFGTFRELFYRSNLDVLDDYTDELESKGYDMDDSLVIKRYLQELKRDISYFMNVVEGGIQ